MEASGTARASRLVAARLALVRAEERAGVTAVDARRVGRALGSPGGTAGVGGPAGEEDGARPPGVLEVPLEDGVTAVLGSVSLLLALAARAQGAEGWCAVVGWPEMGWCAAAEAGLDLGRTLVVPLGGPGTAVPSGTAVLLPVLGALADGVGLLLLGPEAVRALRPRDRRTLLARARGRGTRVLVPVPGEGARVLRARVRGVEDGRGPSPVVDDGVVVPLCPTAPPVPSGRTGAVRGAEEMPAGFLRSVRWEVEDAARAGAPEVVLVGRWGAVPLPSVPPTAPAGSAGGGGTSPAGAVPVSALRGTG